MSVIEALGAIAGGAAAPRGILLQTCRLSALGAEHYGENDIAELFRRSPQSTQAADTVRTTRHAALIWPDMALIADLSGEHIARLWRLGPGEPVDSEPAAAVPFDPDMAQRPDEVLFDPALHPDLDRAAAGAVRVAGERLSREWTTPDGAPAARARPFVIRAFSQGERTVSLFAVHVLAGSAQRHAGFVHAAAIIAGDETRFIRDGAADAALPTIPWRPCIG